MAVDFVLKWLKTADTLHPAFVRKAIFSMDFVREHASSHLSLMSGQMNLTSYFSQINTKQPSERLISFISEVMVLMQWVQTFRSFG